MYRYKNNVYAIMHGASSFPDINGMVTFGRTKRGVLITAEIYGLPEKEKSGVFSFCIHNGACMSLDKNGDFLKSKGCFNPDGEKAPMRAGDLPPLFSFDGYAYLQVVTDRFFIDDIIGKSVIINLPEAGCFFAESSQSEKKIACGIILST